jgi:hypothetical protein
MIDPPFSSHRFGEKDQKEIMMSGKLRTAALSTVVGLAALAAIAGAAQAEGLYLNFGGSRDSGAGVYVGEDGPRHIERDRWHRDRWERGRWGRGACTPDRALDKAERMGVRRARIVDVDRRTIDVAGRRHGDRVVMTFARAPHCPIIG